MANIKDNGRYFIEAKLCNELLLEWQYDILEKLYTPETQPKDVKATLFLVVHADASASY